MQIRPGSNEITNTPIHATSSQLIFAGSADSNESLLNEIREAMVQCRLMQRRTNTFSFPHASPESNAYNNLTIEQLSARQNALAQTIRTKGAGVSTAVLHRLIKEAEAKCAELSNQAAAADTLGVVLTTVASIRTSRI
jgi:hypothetical protein